MQFLCEFFKELVKFFKCIWGGGKSYTTYLKQVLSYDFHISLKNGNIDGG